MYSEMKNFRNIIVFLLILSCLQVILFALPANANNKREQEKAQIEKKIKELKAKEALQINKLTKTQKNLEKTNHSIKECRDKLKQSQENLSKLESKISSLEYENAKLSQSINKRLRDIYKGERITILNVFFTSNNISKFFDNLYYQKLIIKKDQETIRQLQQKKYELAISKRSAAYEKQKISSNLAYMNQKKRELNYSAQATANLIERLRTDRKTYEEAQKELERLSGDIEREIGRSLSGSAIMDSVFIRPIMGAITSPFGWRTHPVFGGRRFHSGVDIGGPNHGAIKASNSGKVLHAGWYGGYGKVVIINHGKAKDGQYKGKKVSTLYAHMSSIAVNNGDTVEKGQIVGYEGTTGYSTGPHLHFEVRIDGKPINPLIFIGK